ncbi:MAG: DnaD domain protein [Dehalococcoides mccartyi]
MMGRTQNNTVEYFPHFAETGKTLYILEEEFGNNGYAFWFKLLELLCRADNHFIDCSDATSWKYISAKTRVSEETSKQILGMLGSLGQIDKELWETHQVIWCQKLVNNLEEVYKKRRRPLPVRPFTEHNAIISVPEMTANTYFRGENDSKHVFSSQKCEQNGISVPEMRQSKVKESKVNKSKVNTPLPPKGFAGAVVSSTGVTDFVDTETGEILPKPSTNTPPFENRKEEPVLNNSAAPADAGFGEICRQYQNNIGNISPLVADGIRDWVDNFPSEWIKEAIREAVLNGVRKPNYINSILENWRVNGFKNKPKNKDAPPPDTSQIDATRANIENQISIRVRQETARIEKAGKRENLDSIRARVRREVEAEYANCGSRT